MPIRIQPIRIGIDINYKQNGKVDKADVFPENFNMLSKILKTYDTFDNDEKDNTLERGNAMTKSKIF
jgi:hypothetical protein